MTFNEFIRKYYPHGTPAASDFEAELSRREAIIRSQGKDLNMQTVRLLKEAK